MLNSMVRFAQVSALGLLVCSAMFGQSATGSLSGTVMDSANAGIPGAKVDARQQESGLTLTTVTSDAGLYVFPNVPPGHWTVSAEKAGFKKLVREGIQIFIAQRQTLDLQLEIGDVTQSVQVTAAPPLLETETSERGQTLSPKMFQTLPLWAGGLQNPDSFLYYMAGVNSGSELSISGSTGRSREILIDGTSNVIPESGGTQFNAPSAESFNEFRLLTGTYTAEYGRTGGGIEIFTTKSGSNELHGTWSYNMFRDIWNAAGWSVNQNPNNPPGYRPKSRLNATSGGVGGPVYIPKVYDGRNKTFFYVASDNDLRPVTPTSVTNTVPTAAEIQGNFSGIPQTIYDPATTSGTTRMPFPNNVIPTSRFSKISANILPFIPAPTAGTLANNHAFVNTTQVTDHYYSFKIDHIFSEKNRISYFQTHDSQLTHAVGDFDGPLGSALGDQYQKPRIIRINHDYTFSPTVLLHSTYGYSSTIQLWNVPAQSGFASKVGFPGLTGDSDVTPVIAFSSTDFPAGSQPGSPTGGMYWGMVQGKVNNGGQDNYTTQVEQGLTWVKNKHEFKMGWVMRRQETYGHDLAGTNGSYIFARNETADPADRGKSTGNSFASFLLGMPDSASAAATPVQFGHIHYQYYGFYFQDNWRVLPKLSLQLGMRYDIPINWYASIMSSVSLTAPNPAANNYPGAYVFPGSGPNRLGVTRFWPTDYKDIGPRAGFAYQITPNTVLRGGFGIFYEATGNGGCGCTLGANGSFAQTSDGVNAPFQWDGGIPKPAGYQPPPFLSPSIGNGLSVDYLGPNFGKAPRLYNWSVELQRQFGNNWVVDAGYYAQRGYSLNSTIDLNQVNPSYLYLGSLLQKQINDPAVVAAGFKAPYPNFPTTGPLGTLAQSLRPFPQYLNVWSRNSGDGRTWYDSAQFKVEHRFGGWQMMASYVRSKSLGQLTYRQIFSQSQVYPQDMYNLDASKSYLPFDYPNVFNFLNSYDLPFGKGKRFLSNANRFVNLLVGNWTIADIHQYRSGALFYLNCTNTLGNGVLFTSARRCDASGGDIRTGLGRTSLDPNDPSSIYFNSGVFSVPDASSFGTSALFNGKFRQPPVLDDRLSIRKDILMWPKGDGERLRLQLSATAFNLFNRTNFGVNGTVGNPNFGRATGPQVGPRIITMGLRLFF